MPGGRIFTIGCSVLAAALLASHAMAGPESRTTVDVVTSYRERLTTKFEEAFERRHPGLHLQIIWKGSRDAMEMFAGKDQPNADVYWSPAPENFRTLAARGAFQRLNIDRSVIPGKIGSQKLSDENEQYEAAEVAGYGVAVNNEVLKERKLPAPEAWRDLAAPSFANQVVMPIAGRDGFSPTLYDVILQSEGWAAGWSLISEIGANAQFAQGPILAAMVAEGKVAAGLTIDFIAQSAAANGRPVSMIYPRRTAFSPAHIAILKAAAHPGAAQAFVDFVLSVEGQVLLMHPDIARHAIRPDAYAKAAAGTLNPFSSADRLFAYDRELTRNRRMLISLLAEVAIAGLHDQSAELWRRIQQSEARGDLGSEARQRLAKARELAGYIPVTADESINEAYLKQVGDGQGDALKAKWREQIEQAHKQALALLERGDGAR
jgi:ABC-type Fe3+ transport system substrate-binding protein